MSKRKRSEGEMIGTLKQMEAARTAVDVARELGVSNTRFYPWRAKYGGLDVSPSAAVAAVAAAEPSW